MKIKSLKRAIKERRKLRVIGTKRTLTTYRKFRKRFPKEEIFYNRHTRKYQRTEFIIREKPRKRIREEEIPTRRIRKQVVLNLRSENSVIAAVSIRAITLNPEITERGLKIAIMEIFKELDFKEEDFYHKSYFGYEDAEISSSEDRRLNDYKVHIEVLIKRNPPINFTK